MGLIDDLSAKFGLTPEQAQGAVGAVARAAKDKLSPDLFGELGKVIPGLDGMIAQAPAPGGGGMFGGLGGMLGGNLGQLAQLAGVFKSLGIDSGKIAPIARTVLDFIRAHGSPELVAAVNQVASKLGV